VKRHRAGSVVVNDASCLIDLRKGQLLDCLVRLPYRLIVPLPVRQSELIRFTRGQWALLDAEVEVFDLPPELVAEAFTLKARFPALSANDCFCLVTARQHENAILLTGDGQLRSIATSEGCQVHGVLWVVDELRRLSLCDEVEIVRALHAWRDDPAVRLPPGEIAHRLR
jgi:predicted nucleic acid-binding protein